MCLCHGVYESREICYCPRRGCYWWPRVILLLQKVADADVWVLETLFQLFCCIFVQVFVAGNSFNCCFGLFNHKSLHKGNLLFFTEVSVSNQETETAVPICPFARVTVELPRIQLWKSFNLRRVEQIWLWKRCWQLLWLYLLLTECLFVPNSCYFVLLDVQAAWVSQFIKPKAV